MSSDAEDIPEVALSRLKFSNWKDGDDSNDPKPGPPPANTTDYVPNSQTTNPLLFDWRRPEAYERMDTDKPGEELAHDATIWKLYLEEAEDYDQELVKSRHASLDMLLLFAALFSAILTAFIIESKDLLQQDPADASATLLLAIAQSQLRIEHGIPPPVVSDPVDLLTFSPPSSARWINGIWFSSLGLSLSAALISMLAKEWLTAYLSSRPRAAHAHVMLRQSRIEGLERWWALHIIALLPSLLHLSLLLFSIGLVIYLWALDVAVAAVIAGVIGLTVLFYVATTVLGAVYEFCPYVTQISSYIKAFRDTYRGSDDTNQNSGSAYTTSNDLEALMWLANNARDPAVVDCSYQALSGLRLPMGNTYSPMTSAPGDPLPPSQLGNMLSQSDKYMSPGSLFEVVCDRFIRTARNLEEPSVSGWANTARYTKVLIGLGCHLQDQASALLKSKQPNDNLLNEIQLPVASPVVKALTALDSLWSENSPPLHAEVYASFVTSELYLLSLVAVLNNHRTPPSGHAIDIIGAPDYPSSSSSLRSQYSRSLARATTLIWAYGHGRVTIGTIPLVKLLNALHAASNCDLLNPADGYSTHHPQTTVGAFALSVPHNGGVNKYMAQEISSGILGSILFLMQNAREEPSDSYLPIRIAAIQTFASLAPVILQQVCGLDRKEALRGLDYTTWLEETPLDMNKIRYIATRQMFLVLRVLGAQVEHHRFCMNTLEAILDILRESNIYLEAANLAISHCGADITPLVEYIAANDFAFSVLDEADSFSIINILRYRFRRGKDFSWNICVAFLPPNCLPLSIRMLKVSGIDKEGAKQLLDSVVERMRNRMDEPPADIPGVRSDIPCVEYLHRFTHVADGYFALGQAALAEQHIEVIMSAIAQITHIAANKDPKLTVDPVELRAEAVPSFLDVALSVANYCIESSERHAMLLEFSIDALDLLDVALNDESSRSHIQEHEAYGKLSSSLATIENNDSARGILKRVHQTMKNLGIPLQEPEPADILAQAEGASNLNLDDGLQEGENEDPEHSDMNKQDSKAAISATRFEGDEHMSKPGSS